MATDKPKRVRPCMSDRLVFDVGAGGWNSVEACLRRGRGMSPGDQDPTQGGLGSGEVRYVPPTQFSAAETQEVARLNGELRIAYRVIAHLSRALLDITGEDRG